MAEQETPQKKEWHLDKTVGVTHLFSTVAAISTLVILGAQFNTRLSLVEQAVLIQHESDTRQDRDAAESRAHTAIALQRINEKLDRLIERGAPYGMTRR